MKEKITIAIIAITGIIYLQCSEDGCGEIKTEQLYRQIDKDDTISLEFMGYEQMDYEIYVKDGHNKVWATEMIKAKKPVQVVGVADMKEWSSFRVAENNQRWSITNGYPTITVNARQASEMIKGKLYYHDNIDKDSAYYYFTINYDLNIKEMLQAPFYVTVNILDSTQSLIHSEIIEDVSIKSASALIQTSDVPHFVALQVFGTSGVISMTLKSTTSVRFKPIKSKYVFKFVPWVYYIENRSICFGVVASKIPIIAWPNISCVSVN